MKNIINKHYSKGLITDENLSKISEEENSKLFSKLIQKDLGFLRKRKPEELNPIPFDWNDILGNMKPKYRAKFKRPHLLSTFLAQKFLNNFTFEDIFKYIWKLVFKKKEYMMFKRISQFSKTSTNSEKKVESGSSQILAAKYIEIIIGLRRKKSDVVRDSGNELAKQIYGRNANKKIELVRLIVKKRESELPREVIFMFYLKTVLRKVYCAIADLLLLNINSLIEKKIFSVRKNTTLDTVSLQLILSHEQEQSDSDSNTDDSSFNSDSDIFSDDESRMSMRTPQNIGIPKKQPKAKEPRKSQREDEDVKHNSSMLNEYKSSNSQQSANILSKSCESPKARGNIFSEEDQSTSKKSTQKTDRVDCTTKNSSSTNSSLLNETKFTLESFVQNQSQGECDIKDFFSSRKRNTNEQAPSNPFQIDEEEGEDSNDEAEPTRTEKDDSDFLKDRILPEGMSSPQKMRTSRDEAEDRVDCTDQSLENIPDRVDCTDQSLEHIPDRVDCTDQSLGGMIRQSFLADRSMQKRLDKREKMFLDKSDLGIELGMIKKKFQDDDILEVKSLRIMYNPHFWRLKKHVYKVKDRFSEETNPIQIMNELCKYKNHNFGIDYQDTTATIQRDKTVRNISTFKCQIKFKSSVTQEATEFKGEIEAKSKKNAKKFVYYIFTQILLDFPFGDLTLRGQSLDKSSFHRDLDIRRNFEAQNESVESSQILQNLDTHREARTLEESFKMNQLSSYENTFKAKVHKFNEKFNNIYERITEQNFRIVDKEILGEFLARIDRKKGAMSNLWASMYSKSKIDILKTILTQQLKEFTLEYVDLEKVKLYKNSSKRVFLEMTNSNMDLIHDFILMGLFIEY